MRPSLTAWRGSWDEARERARFDEALDVSATTIAAVDDADVGFAMIVERPGMLQVHTIAIVPEHQRRGFGSTLVRDLIAIGRQTCRDVVLSVLRVNPGAESFYTRLGFVVFDESDAFRHLRFAEPSRSR